MLNNKCDRTISRLGAARDQLNEVINITKEELKIKIDENDKFYTDQVEIL